jgi:hypothetical protein
MLPSATNSPYRSSSVFGSGVILRLRSQTCSPPSFPRCPGNGSTEP